MLAKSVGPSNCKAQLSTNRGLIKGKLGLHFGELLEENKLEAREEARERRGGAHISSSNPSFPFFFSMFSFVLWTVNPSKML